MGEHDYDAIIIGAGCGAISCGSILAKNGMKVLILENCDRVGGCCSTIERDGFKFDIGASVVEFMGAYDGIFARLGRKREDYIDFVDVDPLYSYRTADGDDIDFPKDVHAVYEVLRKYSERDAKAWLGYHKYWTDSYEEGMDAFLHNDMQSWKSLLKMFARAPSSIKMLPAFYKTYEMMIKQWFQHQVVLDTFGFQSYWVGLPPRLCPGLYSGITANEFQGIWYPKGGMIAIPEGILRAGQEHGLELRLETRVTKVIVKNRRARGVELADGTKLSSKIVISNINAKTLYLDLIGEEELPSRVVKGVKSYEVSMPLSMVYLGVKGDPPLRAQHTLQLGRYQEMNDIWDEYYLKGICPPKPISLLSWPSKSDPGMAPPGHHSLNIGGMGPYELAKGTWDDMREDFIDRTLDFIDESLWPGIRDQVVHRSMSTPVDFERRLLSPKGAVYALQNDIPSTMIFRPSNRSKGVEGLYLTGASTHPGGGVPMVIASGGITSDLILEDFQSLSGVAHSA